MTTLQQRLDRGHVLVLDGATDTELLRRGVPTDGIAAAARGKGSRLLTALSERERGGVAGRGCFQALSRRCRNFTASSCMRKGFCRT